MDMLYVCTDTSHTCAVGYVRSICTSIFCGYFIFHAGGIRTNRIKDGWQQKKEEEH